MGGLVDGSRMLLRVRHPGIDRAALWSVLAAVANPGADAARLEFTEQAEQVGQGSTEPASGPACARPPRRRLYRRTLPELIEQARHAPPRDLARPRAEGLRRF